MRPGAGGSVAAEDRMASGRRTSARAGRNRRPAPSTEAARSERGRARAEAAERRRGRKPRSELSARVLTAIPAIAVALFLDLEGGLVFALGLFALGAVFLHEFYGMYDAPTRRGWPVSPPSRACSRRPSTAASTRSCWWR